MLWGNACEVKWRIFVALFE